MNSSPIEPSAARAPRRALAMIVLLGFVAAACMHLHAPMLGAIGGEFGADAAAVGWIATLTFGGYFAGIVLVVPAGDRVNKRTLVLCQFAALSLGVAAMAAAPTLGAAIAASLVMGLAVSLVQTLISAAADLSSASERGRVLGTVLTSMYLGIFFGRFAAGLIASQFGWRWSFAFAFVLLAALALPLALWLPDMPAGTRLAYFPLLRTLPRLLRAHRSLRLAAATQFFLGICYGGFWATLAPMLAANHRLGPGAAGLMALPGGAGVLVARPAGRWLDRHGAYPVVMAGACSVLAAFLVFSAGAWWVAPLVAGAILLDCGLRASMVANQTMISRVDARARSRVNTVFGAHMWGGNAAGAFLGSTAFAWGGWLAVCAVAAAACLAAIGIQWRSARGI
ncbi:MAG: MFS transporter [Burkholderiales bacterium]|nr:MFS transporter [Burkholderiales bacterium]